MKENDLRFLQGSASLVMSAQNIRRAHGTMDIKPKRQPENITLSYYKFT